MEYDTFERKERSESGDFLQAPGERAGKWETEKNPKLWR